MKKRKIKKVNIILFIAIILLIAVIICYFIFNKEEIKEKITYRNYYVSSDKYNVDLFDAESNKINEILRGSIVKVDKKKYEDENTTVEITIDDVLSYINKNNLVESLADVVKEKEIFVRTAASLYESPEDSKINGLSIKGEKLDIIGYDYLNEDGSVNAYKIKKEEVESYIYKKYVVFNEEEALLNYEPSKYYDVHKERIDKHSGVGGNGANLDYYPVEKPKFEDNIMPEKVYSLYINGANNILKNIDSYINYAKTTKINAFVVDIKDNEVPAYKSKVFEQNSPTSYKYANNSFEDYKAAISKLKEAGFYVIGRITVFKDSYYVRDNPDVAIVDTRTNKPFDNSRWPSAFNRKVWQYNIDLAKEAVTEMGFNEIQFDYVRFPDRTVTQEKNNLLDFKNTYKEEKVQAIQRFLIYACDEIHKLDAYVSVDVFGESVNKYITAYGQYWPAISNVVDVISGMPYPDHFAANSYGLAKPWERPYELMLSWGKEAYDRQQEVPTPAVVRTWILAQNTMKGFEYNSSHIEAQIKGLYDANLTGGYMTWSSSSSLVGYKNRNGAYIKEY